jgi:predicted ester cyclase
MRAEPAQQEGATMSTHENKAVVRRLLEEAWNQNHLAEIDAYVAADRVHHSGTGVGPQGPEALRAGINAWRTGFPDLQYHIAQMIAEDDMVAVCVTFTGTHRGLLRLGPRLLPPTGKPVREAEIFVFRVVNGKIVESWATWDRLSLLEQLDALPEPTPAQR